MAASPSSSGASRSAGSRPAKGRNKFALVFWLILFGGGFYCGIATARWALHGPDYARRILDLPNGSASPAVIATAPTTAGTPAQPPAVSTPASQPGAGTTSPPANPATVPTGTPPATGTPTEPSGKSDAASATPNHTDEKKPDTPAIPSDLKSQIKGYNALLRDIEEQVSRQYANESANTSVAPTDQPMPPEALDELRKTIHTAQAYYDVIVADPNFAKHYEEKEAALPTNAVPAPLVALGPDRLHFIRAK